MRTAILFKGLDISGEWHFGLLSESCGLQGQPNKGYYISNAAGQPWAYLVRPETILLLNENYEQFRREHV